MILVNFIRQQSLSHMVEHLRSRRDVASTAWRPCLILSTDLDGPRPAEEATLVPQPRNESLVERQTRREEATA